MKYSLTSYLLLLASLHVNGQQYQNPVVENYGAVVAMEGALLPEKGGDILIDLTFSGTNEDGLNRGLDRVARLINLYALADIPQAEVNIHVVIHGGATKTMLTHEAYQQRYETNNPNVEIIRALKEAGVSFLVCGQAMVKRGFKLEELNPDVQLAISAITVLVDYQQRGYSLLYY